jgi:hypothetical protein
MRQSCACGGTPFLKAKPTDPTRAAFVAKHGGDDSVYELDALTPAQLTRIFEEAILQVIDVEGYERELAAEERDLKAIAQLKSESWGNKAATLTRKASRRPLTGTCLQPRDDGSALSHGKSARRVCPLGSRTAGGSRGRSRGCP